MTGTAGFQPDLVIYLKLMNSGRHARGSENWFCTPGKHILYSTIYSYDYMIYFGLCW